MGKKSREQEKYNWNAFTQDGKGQLSTSEKKYDKSLQKKYKWLKVK